MSNALSLAQTAASHTSWDTANAWAAIAQAEAMERIAKALEALVPEPKLEVRDDAGNYYGVGGYGSQDR